MRKVSKNQIRNLFHPALAGFYRAIEAREMILFDEKVQFRYSDGFVNYWHDLGTRKGFFKEQRGKKSSKVWVAMYFYGLYDLVFFARCINSEDCCTVLDQTLKDFAKKSRRDF